MSVFSVILLTSMAASWLFVHQSVKHRFAGLKANLPSIHRSAIAVPPDEDQRAPLVALAVDLLRKCHATDPFEALSPAEQRIVLHAHAIEVLPDWMGRYAALGLPRGHREVIVQLLKIHMSRPVRRQEHYGAVKALLRSREES